MPVAFLFCFIPGKLRPESERQTLHRVSDRVAELRSLGSASRDHVHRHLGEVRLPEYILPDAVSEDTPSCSRWICLLSSCTGEAYSFRGLSLSLMVCGALGA